jgi:1,4-alpha-glucan branching enzyme
VIFTWAGGSNTESYDLSITNSDTNQVTSRTNLTTTTATVPLTRGHRYQWRITSKNKGAQTTASDSYKFYLAGDGEENAAPFSAEAIAPQPGSSVTATEAGTVTLSWEAADPDNDTLTYTLIIDTVDGRQDPIAANQNLTTSTKEVSVEAGTVYYWSVITSDGSISVNSDVFSFRVN